MCVDRPVLSLDRPFTYELNASLGAGVGSLVQVPFHGRTVRGWVLGPTEDLPARILPVKKVVSPVRFFDAPMLELLRWIGERYVAPLASVITRSHPPRVASEETGGAQGRAPLAGAVSDPVRESPSPTNSREPTGAALAGYRSGRDLLTAISSGSGPFIMRPDPLDESDVAVGAVHAAIAAGRTAIVLVPESEPLPATATTVAEAYGDRVALFLGGGRRARYRMWLDISDGRYDCVVGTRPAVLAPVRRLGLVWISRESHAGHREERSPYYHVRDVALERARLSDSVCVMTAQCPSAEAIVTGAPEVTPRGRRWPPVEVVKPGPEGRAPRLVAALRESRRAFVYEPLPGAGIAQVCRTCKRPAACALCGGLLREEEGAVRCVVCSADGRCPNCGSRDFGVRGGGAERVERWATRTSPVPVRRLRAGERPAPPGVEEVTVGGMESVKDLGPLHMDLVGILDADLALGRAGIGASERALATWMEAAGWARPKGRVIVQSQRPNDPAVQSLVSGNPERFYRTELPRREDAGFPAGFPVFRVIGSSELVETLRTIQPVSLLVSDAAEQTVCLLTLEPGRVPAFGVLARELAADGVIARVEAEPHL